MPRVHLCKATQAYPGNIWWESPWPGKKGGHKSGSRCQAWSMRLSSSPECPAVCFPAGPTCLTSSVKTVAPPFQLFSKLKMSKLPQLKKDCGIMKFALVAFTCFLSQPSPSQYTLSSVELSLPDPQQTPLRKGPPTGNTDLQQLPK